MNSAEQLPRAVAEPVQSGVDIDLGVIYTHERDYMGPLVQSLAQSGREVTSRLLLVDNASREGVAEWTRSGLPTAVLRNDRRLGYAENLNRIVRASTARYVLLLNTDMEFVPQEQTVTALVRFMDGHPRCGVAGCRLYHADGTYAYPARRFQTLGTIAGRRLGLGWLFARELQDYLYQERDPQSAFACDWLSGCLMCVRREAHEQLGGFDEGFRKYFEDVDYCQRMQQAGWEVLFQGATFAYHYEQRASRRLFSRDAWWHLRSYLRWLWKHGMRQRRPADVRGGIAEGVENRRAA